MRQYIKLLRVPHYIKNILIFIPLLFGGELFNAPLFGCALLGFLSFCFVSSAVYILNDLRDAEKDKLHPTKRLRPIASGAVSKRAAAVLFFAMLIIGFIMTGLIPAENAGKKIEIFLFPTVYIVLNIIYSMGAKNIPLADVAILTAGFLLRLYYGSVVTGIRVSAWLYLTVLCLSLFLSFGKRRNELIKHGEKSRPALSGYTQAFLDKNMYMFLGLSITFYSLWCINNANAGPLLYSTIPIVMLVCVRYSMLIESVSDGDPVSVVVEDKPLIVMIIIYIIFMACSFLIV